MVLVNVGDVSVISKLTMVTLNFLFVIEFRHEGEVSVPILDVWTYTMSCARVRNTMYLGHRPHY